MNRTCLASLPHVLALGALVCTASASAGPRVGSIVGQPYGESSTVQARVVSATPVVAQVEVPQQVCYDEMRQQPAQSSGAGALLGAIAGGAVGNALGKGSGRVITTGLGIFGGAILGNHVETDGRVAQAVPVRRCEQQTGYRNQVVAYDVVYEYAGQRYSTQMTQEPGRTIPVQLTVSPAGAPTAAMAPRMMQPPPAYQYQQYQPEVMVSPPVQMVIQTGYEQRGRWDRGDRWDGEHRWHHR